MKMTISHSESIVNFVKNLSFVDGSLSQELAPKIDRSTVIQASYDVSNILFKVFHFV